VVALVSSIFTNHTTHQTLSLATPISDKSVRLKGEGFNLTNGKKIITTTVVIPEVFNRESICTDRFLLRATPGMAVFQFTYKYIEMGISPFITQ